jgi:DNA-binding NarL/FixJ family response regulator
MHVLTPPPSLWYKCHDPAEEVGTLANSAVRGGTILIVLGDEHEGEIMAACVANAGFPADRVSSGEAGLRAAREATPRLVLLEVELPGICGYEVCHRLRHELGPALPIVLVSHIRTRSFDRVAGLLIGADDYLAEPVDPAELCARVRRLIDRDEGVERLDDFDLTVRERDVLRLLVEGLDQREIAEQLVLSPKTIGTHTGHIFRKLGVHSRTQAVARAYQGNLVDLPPSGRAGNRI